MQNVFGTTNLPFSYKLGKHPKEVGGFSCFGALTEHEADLSVGIIHLGVGFRQVLYLLVGMAIKAVRTC